MSRAMSINTVLRCVDASKDANLDSAVGGVPTTVQQLAKKRTLINVERLVDCPSIIQNLNTSGPRFDAL